MSRHPSVQAAVAALLLSATVAITPSLHAAAADPPSCGKWHSVPTAPIGEGTFFAGAEISPSDIWAGGRQGHDGLLEHWDGHAWTEAAAPFPSAGEAWVRGLSAVSTDDVWAVGSSRGGAFILHFDGSGWSRVPSPSSASGTGAALVAVSASGPDDVWAVGFRLHRKDGWNNLVERWNGQAWSVVPAPSVTPGNDLLGGVTAVAPDDAWIVGTGGLTAHWNGSSFDVVSNRFGGASLAAVSASAPNNVWTGGSPARGSPNTVGRFNGTRWSRKPFGTEDAMFTSLAAQGPGDVWADGYDDVIAHWTGHGWQNASAPPGRGVSLYLDAILRPARTDVWALGFDAHHNGDDPRALHLCPLRILDTGLASSAPITIPFGASISWFVPASDTESHAITDSTGLGLYGSGPIAAGKWFSQVYRSAGTFAYADPSGSSSSIVVPVAVGQGVFGQGGTSFGVHWGAARPPRGYASDIQVRTPSSSTFEPWMTGSTRTSAPYTPAGPGTYSFRARLRSLSGGAVSGWSPTASVAVS